MYLSSIKQIKREMYLFDIYFLSSAYHKDSARFLVFLRVSSPKLLNETKNIRGFREKSSVNERQHLLSDNIRVYSWRFHSYL
jgi:hypothetical protein